MQLSPKIIGCIEQFKAGDDGGSGTADETELEAIALIRQQAYQIRQLQEQNTHKQETIDSLQLQSKQIEAYKGQIQTLKE